jgi:hypothetical protein
MPSPLEILLGIPPPYFLERAKQEKASKFAREQKIDNNIVISNNDWYLEMSAAND